MKLVCQGRNMSLGMKTIIGAIAQRSTLPILGHFLLEAKDKGDVFRLSATDLQMAVVHDMAGTADKGGSIAVPAKRFVDILQTLPPDGEIKMTMSDAGRLTMVCGKARFVVSGSAASEFPAVPKFEKEGAFRVQADVLLEMCRLITFAASTDETRYVLNGVQWVGKDGVLRMEATDGRRLATVSRDVLPKGVEFRAVVPTKMMHELEGMLAGMAGGGVDIRFTENQIAVLTGPTVTISRLVEGNFPNLDQVIPKASKTTAVFDRKALALVVRQATIAVGIGGGSIDLVIGEGAISARAKSQTMEFEDKVDAEVVGPTVEIGFKPEYLADVLKALPQDKVRFSMTDGISPLLVEPVTEKDDYKHVVMPMRRN